LAGKESRLIGGSPENQPRFGRSEEAGVIAHSPDLFEFYSIHQGGFNDKSQ
jgi:hypothetical protein